MAVRFRSVPSLAAVAALVAGCVPAVPPAAPDALPPAPLSGSSWVLDSATNTRPAAQSTATGTVAGGAVEAGSPAPLQASWLLSARGEHPTLTFSADRNAVSGSTGCNTYFGNFSAGPNSLSFGPISTTKMMCFDSLAVQEISYLDALARVTGYVNKGSSLTLSTSDGRQLFFTPLSVSVGAQAATYRYVCDDGLFFTASYDPGTQSAAIKVSTGDSDTLRRERAGSGALYASPRHRLHTKGNEALLDTLSDGLTHRCVAPLSQQG